MVCVNSLLVTTYKQSRKSAGSFPVIFSLFFPLLKRPIKNRTNYPLPFHFHNEVADNLAIMNFHICHNLWAICLHFNLQQGKRKNDVSSGYAVGLGRWGRWWWEELEETGMSRVTWMGRRRMGSVYGVRTRANIIATLRASSMVVTKRTGVVLGKAGTSSVRVIRQ